MKALRLLALYLVFAITGKTFASVIIQFPNGGEVYSIGSQEVISWSSSATNVKLEYSTDNGVSWNTIVSSVPNNGMYNWTIPSAPSSNSLVRVSDAANSSDFDLSNGAFTIGSSATFTLTTTLVNPLCYGSADGSATVSVSGGTAPYTYLWYPGGNTTASYPGLIAGVYTVTVYDALGDALTKTVSLTEPTALNTTSTSSNTCQGLCTGSASISVSGGTTPYMYSWSNSSPTPTITDLCLGNYSFTVTDANGCSASGNLTISEQQLSVIATASSSVICNGDVTTLSVTTAPGATYSWTPGTSLSSTTVASPLATPSASTTFTASVTLNGCVYSDTTVVEVGSTYPTLTILPDSLGVCEGSAVYISAFGAQSYTWNPGGPGATISPTIFATTTYTVTGTSNGCRTVGYSFITVLDTPDLTVDSIPASCGGASDGTATAVVTGGTAPFSYTWNTGATTQSITGLPSNYYYLEITDANGCWNYAYVHVPDSCFYVWPGDANSDNVVDNDDVLAIGLGYGVSESPRLNASLSWIQQYAYDWTDSLTGGTNYKHLDCDGDGIIGFSDTNAVVQNYGFVHANRTIPLTAITGANIYLEASTDSTGEGNAIDVAVKLGDQQTPVDSIYGISFSINYDPTLVDPLFTGMTFNTSWYGTNGTNMIGFAKNLPAQGRIDIALTGIDHLNRSGYGDIGTFRIVTTDNLSGIASLDLTVTDIYAITASENTKQVGAVNDTVVINPLLTSISGRGDMVYSFYPNPAEDELTVAAPSGAELNVELLDLSGKSTLVFVVSGKSTIDVSSLSTGMYLMKVSDGRGVKFEKLVIR